MDYNKIIDTVICKFVHDTLNKIIDKTVDYTLEKNASGAIEIYISKGHYTQYVFSLDPKYKSVTVDAMSVFKEMLSSVLRPYTEFTYDPAQKRFIKGSNISTFTGEDYVCIPITKDIATKLANSIPGLRDMTDVKVRKITV